MRRWWADPHVRWTVVAVGVALVVRLVWVVAVPRPPAGIADPARYLSYGRLIAEGAGYVGTFSGEPTAYYPPGYPFFVGGLAWLSEQTPLTDDLPLVLGVVQAALGAATVAGVAVLARRLLGPLAGVVAAFFLALMPNIVFHSATVLSETLFNALFVAALVVLCRRPWSEGLPTWRVVGFAVVFGLAVLVRPIVVAMLLALPLVWWWQWRDLATVARHVAVAGVALVAVVAPWTVRNAVVLDAFVPISTNTRDNLCIGHQPEAQGGFSFTEACDTGEDTVDGTAAEVRHDEEATDLGLRYLRENLDREPWLVWRRAAITLRDDRDALAAIQSYGEDEFLDDSTERALGVLSDGVWYLLGGPGAVGMVLMASRRHPQGSLVVLSIVATLAVPLVFFGDPRFKVPAVPLLAVTAAAVPTYRRRRRRPPATLLPRPGTERASTR